MQTVSLKSPRFISYLAATFLGAFNDNAFKLVVSLASLSLFADLAAQQRYLSLTSALAILPFVLFSGYAGYFADRYRKSTVLRVSKAAEILAMGAALVVFMSGQNITHLMVTLFLLALHSAFFSPSKYSILPEIMRPEDLAKANGYLNMLTFVAIILGSLSGAMLWGAFKGAPVIIGVILTGIAVLGTVLCLFVPRSPEGNRAKAFHPNPFHEILRGVGLVRPHRLLVISMFGSAMFWLMGALIYLALILLGKTALGLSEAEAGSLFGFLAGGIALGSVIAGHLIGKSERYGAIFYGALLLSLGCIATGFLATGYFMTAFLMALVGMGGGLFVVPVVTLLQRHAPEAQRGQILATSGFFDMVGVLLASGIFSLMGMAQLTPAMMIFMAGCISLGGLVVALMLSPRLAQDALEAAVYFLARRIYRVRLVGDGLVEGEFPKPEKATVFIANHVTYVDGLLLSMLSPKRLRFMVLSTFWKKPLTRYVLTNMGAIPFGTGEANETRMGLEAAKAALSRGECVCIFPEGVLTRTGHIYPFKRGVERLLEGTDAQIIPIHLDRLWGSVFSFSGRRFIRKLPHRLPYPVTVTVGKPLPGDTPAWRLQQIVAEMGSHAVKLRYAAKDTLGAQFLRSCKQHPFAARVGDSTGQRLNGLKLLVATRLMARALRKPLGAEDKVGVMLPASVGGAIANAALAMLGKSSVNLNFSLGSQALREMTTQAGLAHLITTRKLVQSLRMEEMAGLIYIEDLLGGVSPLARLATALQALLLPTALLRRQWLRGAQRIDATATILFSSGSTSTPKGVMLSHANLLANLDAIAQLVAHTEDASPMQPLAGVLPFFHSFGLTTGLWLPLITGRRVHYHANPLEAKRVVRMLEEEGLGILVATPTFARLYAAQVAPESKGPQLIILGGEKLGDATRQALSAAWPSAHLLEGYGATELGPVVAINVPDVVHGGLTHRGYAAGSVGKLLPGVAARIVNPETLASLPPGEEGLILIQSPAMMQGYLADAARTAEAMAEGWYITGDIGLIDKQGFLFITDRLARFSKIGGEMVPHGKVEAALEQIVQPESRVAVIALPDAVKGERLCALTTERGLSAREMHARLKQSGLPNLWLPAWDHIYVVDAIPTLANGKRDLRACRSLAEQQQRVA